jgi:ABC-2 type transport system ATP-binding protein
MIAVDHLTKRYGARTAVDDVSFRVGAGEVVGFLGPNGAGKTTTLRILSGFLGMTSGTVRVCGHDVADDSLEARKSLGYMAEAAPLYTEMRVVEYLLYRAELKRVARSDRRAFVELAMDKARVFDVATQLIGKLSKGYRQRVALADALVANPPLLILDEPTAGLDPNQIREVRDVLRALGKDHTVFLSTHILSEVEASCDRAIVIDRGKIVADATVAELRRRAARAEIVVRGDAQSARKAIESVDVITAVEATAAGELATLTYGWKDGVEDDERSRGVERAIAALVAAGVGVREVRSAAGSLEEVFATLTAAPLPKGGT